mmetsp:Transcript_10819/g.41958  ORF Transcript_10819/g.41958 Transcript_10819/m.41958 type:complete len:403 (+) Transcript_10819:943-2151(+)
MLDEHVRHVDVAVPGAGVGGVDVHGAVAAEEDPGRDGAVHGLEVGLDPGVLGGAGAEVVLGAHGDHVNGPDVVRVPGGVDGIPGHWVPAVGGHAALAARVAAVEESDGAAGGRGGGGVVGLVVAVVERVGGAAQEGLHHVAVGVPDAEEAHCVGDVAHVEDAVVADAPVQILAHAAGSVERGPPVVVPGESTVLSAAAEVGEDEEGGGLVPAGRGGGVERLEVGQVGARGVDDGVVVARPRLQAGEHGHVAHARVEVPVGGRRGVAEVAGCVRLLGLGGEHGGVSDGHASLALDALQPHLLAGGGCLGGPRHAHGGLVGAAEERDAVRQVVVGKGDGANAQSGVAAVDAAVRVSVHGHAAVAEEDDVERHAHVEDAEVDVGHAAGGIASVDRGERVLDRRGR